MQAEKKTEVLADTAKLEKLLEVQVADKGQAQIAVVLSRQVEEMKAIAVLAELHQADYL